MFQLEIPCGFYPQKEEVPLSGFNRLVELQFTRLRYRIGSSERALNSFLEQVDSYAAALAQASPESLAQTVKSLRFESRKMGITPAFLAQAFALIREVSGRSLGMRHFRHQLIGGWAMMQGMIAEMDTGQGKSLCATLTASAAGLAGMPVHVITVNEYLASRDAEAMRPLYHALGLSVAVVLESMSEKEKQLAYGHDIVYCTNKQVAFDYLRDRIVMGRYRGKSHLQLEALYNPNPGLGRLILRGLCFAVVDEADSVLIDEAVTPLVISVTRESKDKRRIYERALALASALTPQEDFLLLAHEDRAELTARGRARLEERGKAAGGLWVSPVPRDELVTQALKVQHFLVRAKHYLVDEGKVKLIDEFTGRIMADRSWESGIQQMVEIKEGCALTDKRDNLAKISYQRFFKRYLNLSGMTGTADEVRSELRSVYGLHVYRVQPAQPPVKNHLPTRFFSTQEDKWAQVVERVRSLHDQGRPVLVGTRTLQASLHLSALLLQSDLPHQLLNAQHHHDEAQIIARAGEAGCITVATNMAGRGTDIKISQEVRAMGGLFVLATEWHESRRIDRQLYGRCGRQGDPGTVEVMVSMDDDLITRYAPPLARSMVSAVGISMTPVQRLGMKFLFAASQSMAEKRQRAARQQVQKLDEHYARLLAFSGRAE